MRTVANSNTFQGFWQPSSLNGCERENALRRLVVRDGMNEAEITCFHPPVKLRGSEPFHIIAPTHFGRVRQICEVGHA